MKRFFYIALINVIFVSCLYAQSGDEFFDKKDYTTAIARYEQEVKLKPEKYFNLAKSYFAIKEFDKAITAMEEYKAKYSSADKVTADKWLALLNRNDEYIEVNNAGGLLNSAQSDYFPYVSKDGERLYFCTNGRTGGYGGEDIWYSDRKPDGTWGEAKNIGTELNTTSHECIMSMSGDGNVAILFGNYEGSFGGGDLFYAVKTEKGWTMPCNLGGAINSKGWESQASLAADGKTLLYISDKDGGYGGGADIYITQLTEKGWSDPINLGPKINTSGFEGWPFLAADGKTLYFFSNGHFGFGGHDIFMAKKIGDSWTDWSEPVNLGKYINTLNDDKYLSIPSSGIKAYTVRDGQLEGFGNSDLYEFILPPSMRPEIVINVYGLVSDEAKLPVGAMIRFYDAATGIEQATATSSFNDGMYSISLPPLKKYNVVIDMKGYLYYTDVLDLTDLTKFMKKDFMDERMAAQLPEIKAIQAKLLELNLQLAAAIADTSEDIDGGFKRYEAIVKQYRTNLNALDLATKRAKLEWLGKEDNIEEVRKDFQLQTIKIGATFELKNIFFDFGKATLREESKVELDKLVDIMKRSEIVIELGGHSDNVGSDEANLSLSQERVNSVKEYLVSKGLNTERIKAVGYGESQPIESNETEEGRQKNRRVEVKILELQFGREGKDVVTDQPKKEEEPTSQFDFLSTLMKAAKTGGLPSGSPCSDKPVYLTEYNKTIPTPTIKPTKTNKFLNFDEVDRKDNFVFKTFNPYIKNSNFAVQTIAGNDVFKGSTLGVGVNFVSDRLREFSMDYSLINEDSVKWKGGMNFNYNWQWFNNFPLLIIFGVNTEFWQYTNSVNGEPGDIYIGMPIGARFNFEIMDGLIIAPEYRYTFGSNVKSMEVGGDKVTAQSWSAGVNARWKFIQGGLFMTSGAFINNAFGFRAGFAL